MVAATSVFAPVTAFAAEEGDAEPSAVETYDETDAEPAEAEPAEAEPAAAEPVAEETTEDPEAEEATEDPEAEEAAEDPEVEETTEDAEGSEDDEENTTTEVSLNQAFYIQFVDNGGNGAVSHVDMREAEEIGVQYYIIGTSGSINSNAAVYDEAYLTFSQWVLTDADGNVVATSEDIDDWNWAVDITGVTNIFDGEGGIEWNIKKLFSKNELSLINGRYVYTTNLLTNGMATPVSTTSSVYDVTANTAALNLVYTDNQWYTADFSNELVLYHNDFCDAFGIVTTKNSTEIGINRGITPLPEKEQCKGPHKSQSWKPVSDDDVPKTGESSMDATVLLYIAVIFGGAFVVSRKFRRA